MPDLLNIALSGLSIHQQALNTSGHNIANVNTPGYSRQSVISGTRQPEANSGLFFGTGVELNGIRRSFDQFLLQQVRSDSSALKHSEMLRQNLDQLDRLFADTNTGLGQNLDNFFSGLQTASNEPTSITTRQALLSAASSLINRFGTIADYLESQEASVNQQINLVSERISALSRQIGDLNFDITQAVSQGAGQQPNDLLDKRDEALRELSELVGISTTEQDDGAVNVFLGKGQALVLGNQVLQLTTKSNELNPEKLELIIRSRGGDSEVGNNVTGGLLGGLLQFRETVLDNAINSIGRMAITISSAVNAQHRLGMDLDGNTNIDFFKDVNSAQAISLRTVANSSNSIPLDQQAQVRIANASQLTTSDYRITFEDTNRYQVVRLTDGAVNTKIAPTLTGTIGSLPATIVFDGLEVRFDRPSGTFQAGDSFLIRPTRSAAQQIDISLQRPEEIALASPVRSEADLNNAGTGVISPGSVTDATVPLFSNPGQLSPPLLIRFTSNTAYDVLDNTNPGAPVPLVPPQTGLTFPPTPPNGLLPTSFGVDINISGQPVAGDTFTLDFNTDGFQDNRNGTALAALQAAKLFENGTVSIEASYGELLQRVGARAAEARADEEAGDALLKQSIARRDAASGVNLDEEAANLIAFEQGYNASAQVIGIARSLFDTLIGVVR